MSQISCSACEDLRTDAPNFVLNGIGETEIASLKNNTGYNASSGNNDCTDLENAVDCLVGNMADEVDAYEVCDWKDFMKRFIPNVWNVLRSIVASICGLWCYMKQFTEQKSYGLHAYEDDDPTKPAINGFKIAQGVSVNYSGVDTAATAIYIYGNVARVTGTLRFDGLMPSSYTNGQSVYWADFFNGGTDITTIGGQSSNKGDTPNGGLLVYQYEVDPCDFGFSRMFSASLFPGTAGDFRCRLVIVRKGGYYPYDWGVDTTQPGNVEGLQLYNPSDSNKILIQVRLEYVNTWGITARGTKIANVTPNGITGVLPCTNEISC